MSKEIHQIRKDLRRGDIATAAAICGCSDVTVKRMLLPETDDLRRNPETDLGKRVIEALTMIQNTRAHLRRKFHGEEAFA